ncbi:MAG: hypothetical protein WC326_06250 [Candidatus Delongbacteria bacterium]
MKPTTWRTRLRLPLLLAALLAAPCLLAPAAQAARFKRGGSTAAPAARPDSLEQTRRPALRPAAPLPGTPGTAGLALRSLVVPGWGQAVLARSRPELQGRGQAGFWLDVGLVTGAWALLHLSQTKQDEFQAYAVRVAGARPHGDASDYWVDVSNHLSRADFNQSMLEAGGYSERYLDPADDWAWPSRSEQTRYRDLRAVSEQAFSQALAVGGAIFLNHVLSAAHVLRLAREEPRLSALPVPGGVGLALSLDLSTPRH